jgi:proteasome lid subunit RPN8/RPN11
MNLSLAPGLYEDVIQHAQQYYPVEGCGLLVGRQGAAARFIPMENVSGSETEYEMEPGALVNALRDLRGTGQELVAIYHSHPRSPARPSKRDIERAYYPEAAHLIVSLADPERPQVAAFRILDCEVLEIELHVIV